MTNLNLTERSKYLIVAFIVLFSIIPIFTRNVIPHDMIENLYWGKELQMGYAKHPPLFAWISFFFYKICFSIPESLYILTQLNLLLGLFFIFQISKLIFSEQMKNYAAIFIFMASICAVFGNEKFNASTILMSLLPAMFFFFMRMMKFRKTTDAVMLGIVSALAFIGKYFALLYIGCIGIFILFDKGSRCILKTSLPYIASIVFLLCISWHLYWIYDSNFVSIQYALEKSVSAKRNFFSPFNFLLMQTVFFFSSFLAVLYAYSGKFKILPEKNNSYSFEERFILFINIIPNAILFLVSLIFGMRIGSFWGTNMAMTIGIYLLIINKQHLNFVKLISFVVRIVLIFAVILFLKLSVARYFLKENDPVKGMHLDKIARIIENDWHKQFHEQPMRIIKADKATAALHFYLKDSPSLYDCKRFDLFNIYDYYPHNTNIVISFLYKKCDSDVEKFKKYYAGYILFDNVIHVTGTYNIYYAFLNTKDHRNE